MRERKSGVGIHDVYLLPRFVELQGALGRTEIRRLPWAVNDAMYRPPRLLLVRLLTALLLVVAGTAFAQDEDVLTAEALTNRSFRFSWSRGEEGGVNGTLGLGDEGRILGISSANESSWEIDEAGRLILRHEDGRVSTTFEEVAVEDGKYRFAGPFHFVEGIVHHLEETEEGATAPEQRGGSLPGPLGFTSQRIVCLDPGEETDFTLRSERVVAVRLVAVDEERDSVVGLVRRAKVRVAIDGEEHTLRCAPYVMPTVIGELRIQADTTTAWTELPKRVQFSLWDAVDPIVDPTRFGFPLRDYRLFAHGLQGYNEPVHLGRGDGDPGGAVFPHSYGIDFAGFEGEQDVLACVEGTVLRLLPDAILVNIIDDQGVIWEYHHLDSIAPHLTVGRRVAKGEKIGVLGRSGPSGNFSHLHVGIHASREHMEAGNYTRRINYYPWIVEAWRSEYGDGPLAVAGAHAVARVDQTVRFDASGSIPADSPIVSRRWELPDGSTAEGNDAEHVFTTPGIHVVTLRVRDAAGREDFDFRKVKVYSRDEAETLLPALFVTSIPTLNARAGEAVRFKIWLHGAEEHPFHVDFGDGEARRGCASFEVIEHVFGAPGRYVVTASATVEGIPTTTKQEVVVRPGPAPEGREGASREEIEHDWLHQDYHAIELPEVLDREREQWRATHLRSGEAGPEPASLATLSCFVSESDAVVERRMIARVLEEIGPASPSLRHEFEALAAAAPPGRDPRWKQLYLRACTSRRAQRLAPLLAHATRFVFNQHPHVPGSWKYTEALSDSPAYRHFRPGSSLEFLEFDGTVGRVRPLLEDPHGMIRNPDVWYDGDRILFAWKKSDREDDYHLYEMTVATGAIRQLTEGLGVADYEGVYLPDGDIVFSSSRCVQTVDCNWVEVSNLFTMSGDGEYLRRLGFDQVHTIFPTVADDGRVLYTRWEYNDRAQIYPQALFQMNPDGTGQREFYGNNSWFPTNLIHARQIPGSRHVVAIVTGHHTPAHGKLGIIDPAQGRQEAEGIELLAPPRRADAVRIDVYGMEGMQFQYPWPIDEERFLVSLALPTAEGKLGRFNLYLVDRDGGRELLVTGAQTGEGKGCRQIIPLAPRPKPHARPSAVDWRSEKGTVYMQDVYEGPGLAGIERGTIDRLRVVGLEYRAAGVGHAQQQGKGGFADVSTPVAIGNGSWDVKVVYGSAKVHEDGSAFFEVPARVPLYFQALDEDGFAVQTMRSWTTLMPGEAQSCVGCHEGQNDTVRAQRQRPRALAAGPQPLDPFFGPPHGFSYTAEVQPIFDRNCVSCHDAGGDAPDLSGELVHLPEMKRMVARSYLELTHTENERGDCDHPLVNWIDCMSEPTLLPPDHRGSRTSGLMRLLKDGHEGVTLTAEELETIACWIDLLVPYCGDYLEHATWSDEERAHYEHFAAKRRHQEELERAGIRALLDR